MTRLRNILFTCIMVVLTCSVLGLECINKVAPSLAVKPESSDVEKRNYVQSDDLLSASFVNGEAQSQFEQYMADGTPFRDAMLFGNAGLQRQVIKCAATVFGYPAFPTFFDSKYNEQPTNGLVFRNVMNVPTDDMVARDAWINTMNDAARNHPEVRFSVAVLADTPQSETNPTYDLTSGDKVNSTWIMENVLDRLDPRLNAVLDPINKTSEIDKYCYNTDLHWTMERALDTYNRIGAELGWKRWDWKDPICVIDEWYGSESRSGLDQTYASTLWDLPIPFDNLEFHQLVDGQLKKKVTHNPGRRADALASRDGKMVQDSVYDGYVKYYGAYQGSMVNKGPNNGKNCLLIGDSFSYCLKRYIADNYAVTFTYLPGNKTIEMSLEDMIVNHEIDDVIVIAQVFKYQQYALHSPKFLGLEESEAVAPDDDSEG